jgi:hypothetical protein
MQISTLRGLGLTQEQVVAMLLRFPRTLYSGCATLETKVRFLVEDMGCSLDDLLSYPAFVTLSLSKRVSMRAFFRNLQGFSPSQNQSARRSGRLLQAEVGLFSNALGG